MAFMVSLTYSYAATVTWDGGAGTTDWMTATNWDTDMLPGAGDIVIISGSSAIVILSGTTTVETVTVAAGATLTIASGASLTIDGSNADHALETTGLTGTITNDGNLTVTNTDGKDGIYSKGTFTNNGTITIDMVDVDNAGLYVPQGTFNNSAGGTITITNVLNDEAYLRTDDNTSSGDLGTFNNDGTITITVSTGNDGLYVNDGSTFNNNSIIDISKAAGASGGDEALYVEDGGVFNNNSGGVITINSSQDNGIYLKNSGFFVNNSGGTINVDAVDNDQISLDDTSDFTNSGTINLTNSNDVGLYVTDKTTFNNGVSGVLNITDATDHGIYVDANSQSPPADLDNSGTITVTGGGSSSDGLRLGEDGTLTNNAGAFIYFVNTGADAIQMDGGTVLDNFGTIDVDGTQNGQEALELVNGSTFNNKAGALYHVDDCDDDGIEVNNGAVFNNDGDIRIDDSAGEDIETFSGFTFNNTSTATFAPGQSPGDFELKGDLDLGTSCTTFEITGLLPTTDYDQIINFSGSTLTISGATAKLEWGFTPAPEDCFHIVDGGGLVSGTFATITSDDPSIVYTVDYSVPTDVIICVEAIVPVELVNFEGRKTDSGTDLTWSTASEINNEAFEIERSNNSTDWITIGRVEGKGNSSTLESYSYLDENPSSGVNYYRLKQNDFDGNFEYSDVIAVNYRTQKDDLTFYPNPAEDVLYIDINEELLNVELQLLDAHGKVVWNNMGWVTQVPLNNLSTGTYILKVNSDSFNTTKKIIKR